MYFDKSGNELTPKQWADYIPNNRQLEKEQIDLDGEPIIIKSWFSGISHGTENGKPLLWEVITDTNSKKDKHKKHKKERTLKTSKSEIDDEFKERSDKIKADKDNTPLIIT